MANKAFMSPTKRPGISFSPSKKSRAGVIDMDIGKLECGQLNNVRLTGFVAEIFEKRPDMTNNPFLKIVLKDKSGHITIWIHNGIEKFKETFKLMEKYVVTIQSGDLKPGRKTDYGDQFYEASIGIKEMVVRAEEGEMISCTLNDLEAMVQKFYQPVAYGKVRADYVESIGISVIDTCPDCHGKLQEDPDAPDEFFCAKCQKAKEPSNDPLYETFQIMLKDKTTSAFVTVYHSVAEQLFGPANHHGNPRIIMEGRLDWMIRKQYKRIQGNAESILILCGAKVAHDAEKSSSTLSPAHSEYNLNVEKETNGYVQD